VGGIRIPPAPDSTRREVIHPVAKKKAAKKKKK
jgi:hypothetical protein